MKVHFLRGATRLLWLALLASSLASCSVYFAKDWREVKPKFRKRYYIPEQSDKVADIRYEVFNAKTGKDLSSRFRKKKPTSTRETTNFCWFDTSTTPMEKKVSMCNPSPLKIAYLVYHLQEWPWEVSI